MYTLHPWHGVELGDSAPEECIVYVEIVPSDTIKYEIDKRSGLLKIDRPQRYSNILPALYGFFPQTYCGKEVAEYCMQQSGLKNIEGDHDPLDVCVLTSKNIPRNNVLVNAIPLGGFRMIDGGEADDKIIAVLKGDDVYRNWNDIGDIPEGLLERLRHYFLTYKNLPHESPKKVNIEATFGVKEARTIIQKSVRDYQNEIVK